MSDYSRAILTACALLAVGLSSCRVSSVRIDALPGDVSKFVEGETHYREALERLGPPARVGALTDGFAFFYGSLDFDERQFVLSYRAAQVGGSNGDTDYAYCSLRFDDDGLLREVRRSLGNLDLGQGGIVGPTTAADPFYGARRYSPPPPQLLWGQNSLRRIGRTLNPSGDVEYGEGGVENYFTPRGQGQHTMEQPQPVRVRAIPFGPFEQF